MFIPAFMTNMMTSHFLALKIPRLVGDIPTRPSYGVYIPQLVRFSRFCTSVLDFNFKNLNPFKLLIQGYITSFENIWKVLQVILGAFFQILWKIVSTSSELSRFCLHEYISKWIFHPVVYGDLVYKPWRVKCEANFVSSDWKIVKRLRRRKYDQVIIEKTIGLVLIPSTALFRSFLKYCTPTNKAVWRDSSKPPQRWQGSDPCPIWL